VLALTCDIREPAQVEAMVKEIIATWGRLDVLVNNAEVSSHRPRS